MTDYMHSTVLALVFVPQANELYYDLGGTAGFLSTSIISLYSSHLKIKFRDRVPGATLPPLTHFAPRQLLLTTAVMAWSARLGSFLFSVRSHFAGEPFRSCANIVLLEGTQGRR